MLDSKIHLSITLTEPVVFLRSSDPSGRHQPDVNDPLTLVRGILNLNVVKPAGISSIEAALTGVQTVICPEGIGAGRVEVPETHRIFSSTVDVFRAGQVSRYGKRRASVGPGLGLSTASGIDHNHATTSLASPPPSPPSREWPECRINVHSDFGPTPPYTPLVPASNLPRPCSHLENPAQTLEELRQALRDNLDVHRNESVTGPRRHSATFGHLNPTAHADVFCASDESLDDPRTHDLALSSPPFDNTSFHNNLEDTPSSPSHPHRTHSPESHGTHPRTRENSHERTTARSRLRLSLNSVLGAVMEVTRASVRSRSVAGSEDRERGRSRVRPERLNIPETGEHAPGARNNQHPAGYAELLGLGRVLGLERDHEKDKDGGHKFKEHEGWTEFKPGTYSYPISFLLPPHLPPTFSLPHGSLNYTIKAVVHRPGAFTSKLSCQIPLLVVAAPAIGVGEGGDPGPLSVERQWEGKLAYSFGLSSRLFLVGSRRHLEVENIRQSSESLAQAEAEPGSEPEYGTVILDLSLLPLEKIKIWKISVAVDQRIKHVDDLGRLQRDDDFIRVPLLDLQDSCTADEIGQTDEDKQKSKNGLVQIPLLPTPLSPHRSPLVRYIPPSLDLSALAGPGPYTFSAVIGLPGCNDAPSDLEFTVKHKCSNVKVEHTLRVILRVESVDDHRNENGDKKKLFDIAVQTPVTILSCRCAPEYQTLPRYSQITQDSSSDDDPCLCQPTSSLVHVAEPDSYDVERPGTHHPSSMTPSSTLSFESESSCGPGSAALAPHHTHHRHDPTDADHGQQQHCHGNPECSRPSSHTPAPGNGPTCPPPSPVVSRESHRSGTNWSRSPSVHGQDRAPSAHSHVAHHHPHHHRRPRSGSRHSHPHSRAHTPASPHPSRPPSPVLARRYERLVSGLESDAGEAPPSYYESITSNF